MKRKVSMAKLKYLDQMQVPIALGLRFLNFEILSIKILHRIDPTKWTLWSIYEINWPHYQCVAS